MPMPAPILIPLEPRHLPEALRLQAQVYPPFLVEPEDAFASRRTTAAPYCLAAERDGVLVAYLLAHGWPRETPPPVGAVLDPTIRGDTLFVHDLAVSPAARCTGVGRALVEHTVTLARADGVGRAELIAIEGAAPFWTGLGFAPGPASPALAAKVAGYGAGARWMVRTL